MAGLSDGLIPGVTLGRIKPGGADHIAIGLRWRERVLCALPDAWGTACAIGGFG